MTNTARELDARALCRVAHYPEDSTFEGRRMWEICMPEDDAVLEAIGWDKLGLIPVYRMKLEP